MERILAAIDRLCCEADAATGEIDEEYLIAVESDGTMLAGYLLPFLLATLYVIVAAAMQRVVPALAGSTRESSAHRSVVPCDDVGRLRLAFVRWLYEQGRLKD